MLRHIIIEPPSRSGVAIYLRAPYITCSLVQVSKATQPQDGEHQDEFPQPRIDLFVPASKFSVPKWCTTGTSR